MELSNTLNMDGNKITSVGQATNDNEAPNWGQVRALFEGNNWKDSVRAASTANVTISGPGASIDGVTLANGDRILLKNQTTVSQNGIYIFNGAAAAATRALDADTWDELEAATVRVEEGTANAGTKWAQTQVNGTLDTNDIVFVSDTSTAPAASETTAGVSEYATQGETDAGTADDKTVTPLKLKTSPFAARGYSALVGDNSATSFNIDHNLGTKNVIVQMFRNSDGVEVTPGVARTTTNRVVLTFGSTSVPGTDEYTILISRVGG